VFQSEKLWIGSRQAQHPCIASVDASKQGFDDALKHLATQMMFHKLGDGKITVTMPLRPEEIHST